MDVRQLLKTPHVFETCMVRYQFPLNYQFHEMKCYYDHYPTVVYDPLYQPYVEFFASYFATHTEVIDFVLYSYLLFHMDASLLTQMHRFLVSHLLRNGFLSYEDATPYEEMKTKTKMEVLAELRQLIEQRDTILVMFLLCFGVFM